MRYLHWGNGYSLFLWRLVVYNFIIESWIDHALHFQFSIFNFQLIKYDIN